MGRGKENQADYVTKHHPIWHQRTMKSRYLKHTEKDIKTQNSSKLGPEEGVLELTILG